MSAYMFILYLIVLGLAAGWIAHLIVQRHAPKNWTVLFIVGIAGSFLGGLVGSLLQGGGFRLRLGGIIGSILGATVLLAIYDAVQGRRHAAERKRRRELGPEGLGTHHQPRKRR